jgi:hypothetical protein
LTVLASADILSVMKTFTVRELDREPSRVLDTCDRQGAVRIRRRDGRTYTMQLERNGNFSWSEWLAERRRRTKEIFGEQSIMTKKELREFDRLIRSDREI